MATMAVALVLGTLSGCAPSPTPSHTPSSTPRSTPVFSSDKEALAAATKAYAAYLRVSDEIAHDGGADPERIKAVATGEALRHLMADISRYSARHLRTTGNTKIRDIKLQSHSAPPREKVALYVCEDVSDVDVLDQSGASIVDPDRDPTTPFSVELVVQNDRLKLSSKSIWNGSDFCT